MSAVRVNVFLNKSVAKITKETFLVVLGCQTMLK